MAQTIVTVGELRAEYHGGAYIDLSFAADPLHRAFEVINVYDYAAGRSRLENTPAAVTAKVAEWLAEYGESYAVDLQADHERGSHDPDVNATGPFVGCPDCEQAL